MLYASSQEWKNADQKRIMLFGMSGLGKSYLSNILRDSGSWFHYSVDYRIGTRYMGEHIVDNFKVEAMQNPFLEELLRSDSIYIASNITFNNLAPLASYLGKPGNKDKGGITFEEYLRRQRLHKKAEIAAMLDTRHFIDRSKQLYGYDNFVCDTSGSIVEIVDEEDENDPVMREVTQDLLPIWLKGSEAHTEILIERFSKNPKPMYYNEAFLLEAWQNYLREQEVSEEEVDPNHFMLWGYRKLIESRASRYEKLANRWGITIEAEKLADIKTAAQFNDLIEQALDIKKTL